MEFSILGGPLHRLGVRLRLARADSTVALGLALGWLSWAILVLFALAQGGATKIFALPLIAVHARLLLAAPLLFIAETALDAKVREFGALVAETGITRGRASLELQATAARIMRWKNSWLPDATSVAAAAVLSLLWARMQSSGGNLHESSQTLRALPLASAWYWFACLPLFRFLVFRWAWRLAFWWIFLWRLSTVDLQLRPAHPDAVGGLGYLEIVHMRFAPLVFAISVVVSATFAEDIASGRSSLMGVYPALLTTLLLDAVLFVAPLCILVVKLRDCQERGLRDYSALSSRYVAGFEQKWIAGEEPREPLLGTADIQSLADLSNSFAVVKKMRLAPISARLLINLGASALAPMLPLLFFDYPLLQIIRVLLRKLVGM